MGLNTSRDRAIRRRREAVEFLHLAMVELAEANGHELTRRGLALEGGEGGVLSAECVRCQRWLVIDLASDDPGVRGRMLAMCKGTRWGPVAADDGATSNFAAATAMAAPGG